MLTKLNVIGIGGVRQQLRNLADRVPDNARKVMHRSADKIVERARAYAPEDVGNLVGSIRILKDYTVGRGRLMIDIVAGGVDGFSKSGTYIPNIDRYVQIIHENYEQFEPGPKTREKMARNPGKVGSGFLTRAAEEEEEKLTRAMIDSTTAIIKEEDVQ